LFLIFFIAFRMFSVIARKHAERDKKTENMRNAGRLKMQALSNAIPWKWRTKSHPWNLQNLENEGPNRRGWKMQDQFELKNLENLLHDN